MPTLLIHLPRKQPSMFILVVVWEQHCIRGLLFPCNTIPFLVEVEKKVLGANDTIQGNFSIPSYDSTSPQPLQIETAIPKIQRKPLLTFHHIAWFIGTMIVVCEIIPITSYNLSLHRKRFWIITRCFGWGAKKCLSRLVRSGFLPNFPSKKRVVWIWIAQIIFRNKTMQAPVVANGLKKCAFFPSDILSRFNNETSTHTHSPLKFVRVNNETRQTWISLKNMTSTSSPNHIS